MVTMRNFKICITATSIALLVATAAFAANPLPKSTDNTAEYGKAEGWTIYTNNTRRDCFIERVVGPTAVQMGVTSDKDVVYLGVFTKEDIGVKDLSKSEIFVSIDGNLYAGVAIGTEGKLEKGYSGGYILSDNPDFKRDLAKKYKMIVFPETKGAFIVNLKGTYKAIAMGRKCYKEQQAK